MNPRLAEVASETPHNIDGCMPLLGRLPTILYFTAN